MVWKEIMKSNNETSGNIDLVELNTVVKRCRQIVVNNETDALGAIVSSITSYTLTARQELNEGMIENNPSKFVLADYHLRCVVEMNKCLDVMVERMEDGVTQESSYSWGLNK